MQNNDEDVLIVKESEAWLYDMYLNASVWLKRCLVVIVVLSVALILSLIANLNLAPLKEKVPYLYSFDHATGEVTKLGRLEASTMTADWAMTRYFLITYTLNRESYDYYNIDHPYQIAWAMSDYNVQTQYEGDVNSSSASSPYKMYGKDKYITVVVKSVSQLNANTASVKFEKILHDRNSSAQSVVEREAIVKWKYVNPDTTQKMLDRDPLGFKMVYYQTSQVN